MEGEFLASPICISTRRGAYARSFSVMAGRRGELDYLTAMPIRACEIVGVFLAYLRVQIDAVGFGGVKQADSNIGQLFPEIRPISVTICL